MARARLKTATEALPIPQDDSQAREAIREIGDLNREAMRIEAELNDKVAALSQEYGERIAPLQEQVRAKQDGLKVFCEANRDRLTQNNRVKFHRFATGEISWRLRPAKITVRGKESVIEAIKAAGLKKRFLRIKEEINKEAMLEDRTTAAVIKGISVGSDGEDFIVEPNETELQQAS
ncbi:host-nuclease inhibitor Gam family protein [Flexibacterium corallicola]|uniref:host-nuclease inhibitor Gam family protein n=1 Tax=Flexibacterium corallicola TaxID=3037259 RepID=UPI00286F8169|nr:host-nuclease inhibitor Gam family protein [Pseudovibrio sp. M1P-2-3]